MDKFQRTFSYILKHQFLSGSLIMVIGSNIYNFSQFVYHFLSGRFLGKSDYGDLATIISLLGFISIIQLGFNLTVIKFIASNKDKQILSDFIKWVFKWSLITGLILAGFTMLIASHAAAFLNLRVEYILMLGPILLFFIITTSGRSVLHGLLRFDQFVYSLLAEAFGKIVATLILLYAGFAVFGTLFAFLIGIALSFVITFILLRKYLVGEIKQKPEVVPLIKYSLAVFIQGLALTSMYTTDLILVKHFFPSEVGGLYAALAILGRIVFFGTIPIASVMFPIVVKRHLNGEKYRNILFMSLLLILAVSVVVTAAYYFFPVLPLGLLYGKNYLDGSEILWWFGVFMTLLSFAMVMTQFYLSINKTKIVYLFVFAALLQAGLIWFFHTTILMVIQVSILSAALLDLALFVYYPYHNRK